MKVVMPFTNRNESVIDALRSDDIDPILHPIHTDTGYWELLAKMWSEQETFVIIEHDIIPWPGAIRAMIACHHGWCAHAYKIGGYYSPGLGCTKFSAEIMKAHPTALELAGDHLCPYFSSPGDPRYWSGLDARLGLVLSALAGIGWPHRHEPPVVHLNPLHWQPGTAMPDSYRGKP